MGKGTTFTIRLPMDHAMEADTNGSTELALSKAEGLTTRGGIDFDPKNLDMQVQAQGRGFRFDVDGQSIDAAQITGAEFVIRQMTPVTNLPSAIGLNTAP